MENKILVTGATGNIGSAVVRLLAEKDVACVPGTELRSYDPITP